MSEHYKRKNKIKLESTTINVPIEQFEFSDHYDRPILVHNNVLFVILGRSRIPDPKVYLTS